MDLVKQEQIRILNRLTLPTVLMSYFVALLLVAGYWQVIPQRFLLYWLLLITVITAVRSIMSIYFIRTRTAEVEVSNIWGIAHCLGALAAGCTWSILGFQFDSSWPSVYQLILFTTLAGLIAGAAGSHSCYFPALASFYTPVLASMIWVSGRQNDPEYLWLVPLILVFWVIVYSGARRFSNMLKENIGFQQSLSKANGKLELLARVDTLTQLQNRSGLENYLNDIWREFLPLNAPVSIAMIDVDKFKPYNDFYGHVEGDKCLVHVANVMRLIIPAETGFVGRYGGEEFIIVLPDMEHESAIKLMKSLMCHLENENIEHRCSEVADHITVSIGVETTKPSHLGEWVSVIDRADAKLYIAKQRGRARVVG